MTPSGKCHIATFGCRVNQADSEGIADTLRQRGFTAAESREDADVVVINSCTVTHRSDADIRKLVHRLHRENPKAKVIVTGCYAQRDPEALVQLKGLAAVVGNSDAHRLGDVVDELVARAGGAPLVAHSEMDALAPEDLPPMSPVAVVHDRTRPFIKIQDGCDAACTYCVIPQVRGPARSAPEDGVIAAIKELAARGHFEVVLTGIHLGTYGRGLEDGASLARLVRRVLDETPGLGRLRLSCIEPMAFPLELADFARDDPRLAPHFHLPLQSGADRVLKRMARPYRAAEFKEIIDHLRERVPQACIGTDIMVGFPGETDEEFDETCAFAQTAGFDCVHVFSYSDRHGVPSTRLGPKVDPRISKGRSVRLNAIGASLWQAFLDRQVGRTLDALTLARQEHDAGIVQALSAEYCPVRFDAPTLVANTRVRVRILRRNHDELWGEQA